MGYPIGGESLSVTAGVVSRIELQEYAQGGETLLAIQIDAAINSGNSGGPVINEHDQLVGVAFQSLATLDSENIGCVGLKGLVGWFVCLFGLFGCRPPLPPSPRVKHRHHH